jgi:hypothetical protein
MDHTQITSIKFNWGENPLYPLVQKAMNNLYSEFVDDAAVINTLFADGAIRTTIVADPMAVIRGILHDLIGVVVMTTVPVTVPPYVMPNITPHITACSFRSIHDDGKRLLRNAAHVTAAFEDINRAVKRILTIEIGWDNLHPNVAAVNFNPIEWTQFQPNVPFAGVVLPTIHYHTVPAAAGGPPPVVAMVAAPPPDPVFNPAMFPADVQARYAARNAAVGIVLGNTLVKFAAPVAGGFDTWYSEGAMPHGGGVNEFIVLRDGTAYVTKPMNEKEFQRNPINCADVTPAGVRQWYRALTRHCHGHGVFLYPFDCFIRDKGGDMGFTIGNDTDDDIPPRFQIMVDTAKDPLWRLLSKKGVFPEDSKYADIIRQNYGDGYIAIAQILYDCHPAFHPTPATLVMDCPRQKEDESPGEYYT